jgi:hypothetical protein
VPTGGLFFDGGSGTNTVSVIGHAGFHSLFVGGVTIPTPSTTISVDSLTVTCVDTQNVVIDPGAGDDSLSVSAVPVSLPVPPVIAGSDTSAMAFSSINIGAGGMLKVPTRFNGNAFDHSHRTAITVDALTLAPGGAMNPGKLDLGDNDLNLNGGVSLPAPLVQSYLHSGQLFTSTAGGVLGYLSLASGQTQVRFTLLGDTNLDGHVDVTDLGNLASSYGAGSGAVWVQGDTNYDGAVDVTDLGNLASNYGGNLGGSLDGSPVMATLPVSTVATPADRSATPPAAHAIPATSPAIPWRGGINGVATVSFEDATDRLYQDLEPVLGVRTTAAGQGRRSDGNG